MPATIDRTGTVTQSITFEIVENPERNLPGRAKFAITRNGVYLRTRDGLIRDFTTRNGARKRISRERSQNFSR